MYEQKNGTGREGCPLLILLLCVLLGALPLAAQQSPFRIKEAQKALVERLVAFGKTIPQEKVYIHMDNTCYFQGDTIWFAAYTRQTTDDRPSRVSRVLYVELLNQDGYLVERKLIEMQKGRGEGFFALNNTIQYSGFYELRAYTRWQLNWGQFQHKIPYSARNEIRFKGVRNYIYRDFEKLYSRVFPVYDRPKEEGEYARDMTLRPLRRYFTKDMEEAEREPTLTFYPEGGNLIAGVENRVAFEAVMSDGEWLEGSLTPTQPHPLPLSGERGDSILTLNRGRGVFTIVPEAEREYKMTFTTMDGLTVKEKLPRAEAKGVAIQVNQVGDSIVIEMCMAGLSPDSLGMTVMHEGRGEKFAMLGDAVNLDKDPSGSYVRLWMTTKSLRCGVNQVTVFDTKGRVYADRLFFVTKPDEMQPTLAVTTSKDQFAPYEPIELSIQGQAQDTPISLTVRDKAHQDLLFDNASIMTEMLLASEIRGFVPDPGWFFERDDDEHRTALDLLMMTQGWRRFNWRDMAVRGEWDLTEPNEQVPIICGTVYRKYAYGSDLMPYEIKADNMSLKNLFSFNLSQGSFGISRSEGGENVKNRNVPQEQGERTISNAQEDQDTDGEIPSGSLEISKQLSKNNLNGDYKREVRVHAEIVLADFDTSAVGDIQTKLGQFRIQLPRFYGKGVLFLSAADTVKWNKGKPYTWIQILQDEEDLPAGLRNRVRFFNDENNLRLWIRRPYPRFVKPYSFYHTQMMQYADTNGAQASHLSDGTHVMKEVPIYARHGGLRSFDDSNPVLVMDAYDAFNYEYDMWSNLASAITNYYGLDSPYVLEPVNGEVVLDDRVRYVNGLNVTRRSMPPYNQIPSDSLYSRKYLKSFLGLNMAPSEWKYYTLSYLDKIYIYTDYSPRLEGSRRYQGSNLPEMRIARYPFPDGSRRPVYRDRRFVLDGFAYPAEFYNPDYSRQRPQEPTDYRRTLYWNPSLQLDEQGRAHVTLYNNCRMTQISVSAAGQAENGQLLWNK